MNTNKLFIMTCFFLSTLLNIYAQFPEEPPEFAWVKKAGGMGSISANDVVSDTSGNIYVTGTISGTITIDTTTITCTGRGESFLAKYNASGNLLWIKQTSCPEHELIVSKSIAKDDPDNLYITGYYDATTVDFGTASLPASSKQDLFVAKYNKNGVLQWARQYGDIKDNQGSQITADPSGNIYLINSDGNFHSESSVIKYNTDGTFQWAKDIQASCRDLAVFNTNLYVTGGIFGYGDIVIGDTTITANCKEVFIAKIDLNGNYDWVKIISFGSTLYNFSSVYISSLQIDNNENIYLAGYYENWIAYGADTLFNPIEPYVWDIYLLKLNNAGHFQWFSRSGFLNNSGFFMPWDFYLDPSGNPYILGLGISPIILENDTLNETGSFNFISKYNSDGNHLGTEVLKDYPRKISG